MKKNWTLDDLEGKKFRSLSGDTKAKKIIVVREELEQERLIKILDKKYPRVLYCASAGGLWTTKLQGGKMKAAGYKKGFPDIMIFEPRGGYSGLFIELKRITGGTVSPEQKEWLGRLNARGYMAIVCKGCMNAVAALDKYLAL